MGVALIASSAPAFAAKEAEEPAEASEKDIARSIELSGMVFPVFGEDHKLKNYLFVSARMLVADGKDPWKYRENAHFIRDAVLSAAHSTSLHKGDDYLAFNEELAREVCLKAANDAVGDAGAMASITFTQIASQTQF